MDLRIYVEYLIVMIKHVLIQVREIVMLIERFPPMNLNVTNDQFCTLYLLIYLFYLQAKLKEK